MSSKTNCIDCGKETEGKNKNQIKRCWDCHLENRRANPKTGIPCSVEGCTGLAIARGWCERCYRQWRDDEAVLGFCSVDGCSEPVQAKGWCMAHYQIWWRT